MSSSSSWYSVRVSSTKFSPTRCAVARLVELELGEGERFRLGVGVRAQQRAQTGLQLADVERLDHVVVGAGVQSLDPVVDRVAGGEDQDRHPVARRGAGGADLEPVDARQADVEHHGVGIGDPNSSIACSPSSATWTS